MTVPNALGPKTTDLYQTPVSALDLLYENVKLPPLLWKPRKNTCLKSRLVPAGAVS